MNDLHDFIMKASYTAMRTFSDELEAQLQRLLDEGYTLEFLRNNLEIVHYPDEYDLGCTIRYSALRWNNKAALELGAEEFGRVRMMLKFNEPT